MTFIITFIALIIERFFHWGHLRHWQWFGRYQYFLTTRLANWPGFLLLIVSVLPVLMVVGIIEFAICGWLYNIPKLIFGLIILLYCMGPNNLWVQIYSCIRALNKEEPHVAIEQVKTVFGITAVDQSQNFHQSFTRAIFIAANQRIFAVIFWFAVLGPIGAILYRVISLSTNSSVSSVTQAAVYMQKVLDWIPARAITFIFALGGHFTLVFARWKQHVKQGIDSNDAILGECGIAGLCVANGDQLPEDGAAEKEALALLDRVFVMALVILAAAVFVT